MQSKGIYRIDRECGWTPILTADQMIQRIQMLTCRPYDVMYHNCDHLVKWVIGRPVESPQVHVALTVAATLAVLRLLQ